MKHYGKLEEYSVLEINKILETLGESYDSVRLVDVEECRLLEVLPNGEIRHGQECFRLWNRKTRCEDCSGYRACKTHCIWDKTDHLDGYKEKIHSVPIYLEMLNGEMEMCVIECIKNVGKDREGAVQASGEGETYISTHDVLTRLYTQEKLFRAIRQRLIDRPDDQYLLVMGNIRNFKLVNKLFGIEGGNRILVGVADILRQECTKEEVYGRYRDDRFVLLVKKDKFHEIAFADHLQKVKNLVESPIYTVQIKLGVYEITDVELPVAAMMDRADAAANTIRNSRDRHIAHYEPSMMESRLRDQHILADFEQALRDGEFQIYLQPQVRQDGLIIGAEALVRWIRPDGTVRQPLYFLDVLHRSELLSHLDLYVWEKAAAQLRRWKGTEFERLYISVNVDPSDFYYLDVPKELKRICRAQEISPQLLRVEMTETALVEDLEKQGQIVERLHSEGFAVEIDDFGKGSSSLSLLKDIHAEVLKIDMGFVRGKSNLNRSRIILESVIEMAENLHMGVVTEGVETRDQVERLVKLGCHYFQGFFFSRPLPIDDFEAVARANLDSRKNEIG